MERHNNGVAARTLNFRVSRGVQTAADAERYYRMTGDMADCVTWEGDLWQCLSDHAAPQCPVAAAHHGRGTVHVGHRAFVVGHSHTPRRKGRDVPCLLSDKGREAITPLHVEGMNKYPERGLLW